jgi:ribosomal protein S24E
MIDIDAVIAWLREQLAEDERVALAVKADLIERGHKPTILYDLRHTEGNTTTITRVALYNSAERLLEIEAKRRIVKEMTWVLANSTPERAVWDYASLTVRLLALSYAARPGYDESWRP